MRNGNSRWYDATKQELDQINEFSPETKVSDFGEEAGWFTQLTSCQTDEVPSTDFEY